MVEVLHVTHLLARYMYCVFIGPGTELCIGVVIVCGINTERIEILNHVMILVTVGSSLCHGLVLITFLQIVAVQGVSDLTFQELSRVTSGHAGADCCRSELLVVVEAVHDHAAALAGNQRIDRRLGRC